MLAERTLDTGTVTLHYVEGPDAGPPLLLLHGVTSRWQSFLNVMPVFTQRWHVFAADLRGHGHSGRVDGRYGLMEYAADVVALLRHLGERLRRIACPTLILQGNPELGGALTDLEARWAASLIGDCTHVYLPNVGHGIHTGESAAYSHLVTSFLEAL
jgi:pimeloyl-ACP methyl ester carboxylesterase